MAASIAYAGRRRTVRSRQLWKVVRSIMAAPCGLLAVDGVCRADANGNLATRDMPRVRYAGAFAVDQIPAISLAVRGRADIQFYAGAPAAKAIAFHPWGQSIRSPAPIRTRPRRGRSRRAMARRRGTRRAAPAISTRRPIKSFFPGDCGNRLRRPAAAVALPIITPPAPRVDDPALLAALIERISKSATTNRSGGVGNGRSGLSLLAGWAQGDRCRSRPCGLGGASDQHRRRDYGAGTMSASAGLLLRAHGQ